MTQKSSNIMTNTKYMYRIEKHIFVVVLADEFVITIKPSDDQIG